MGKFLEKKWMKETIEYLVVIMVILGIATCLMFFQLKNQVWLIGDDTFFHDSRFYDTAQQIKNHNFSYFQMNYGAGQAGRIINALYGPIFAYLLGGLVLFTGTWLKFQIVQNYLLFLVGGIGMYLFTKKLKAAKWAALLSMSLFLVTGYMSYWIKGGTFNSWGAALIPYVLIQGQNMIRSTKKQINWISLGVMMAIVGQVHLLSVLFSGLALIPFFIYGFVISEEREKLLISLIKAIGLFIVLTSNVWGAFLLLNPTNKMSTTFSYPMFETALHLGDLTLRNVILLSTLLLIALQMIYAVFAWKKSKINLFITLEGIFFLILSSQLLPWNKIQARFPSLGYSLQFPNRFTVIAYPLLFAAIGYSLTQLMSGVKVAKVVGIVGIGFLIFNIGSNLLRDTMSVRQQGHAAVKTLGVVKWGRETNIKLLMDQFPGVNPEYLPLHKKIESKEINQILFQKLYGPSHLPYTKTAISGGRMLVEWTGEKANKEVLLPIVMYKQSQLNLNGKTKDTVQSFNAVGMPYVKSKIGKNRAILSFKTPIWFTCLLWITMIGWIGIIGTSIYKKSLGKN